MSIIIIQKSASLHNTLATTGMLYELFCLRGRRLLRLREITFCLGNMYPVHSIWTKDGKDMVFDLQNKPTEYFLIFLKIQDGGLRSKVQNRPNLTPQITFRLGIYIPFIRFGQDLAWTYFLALQTSLPKKFLIYRKIQDGGGCPYRK